MRQIVYAQLENADGDIVRPDLSIDVITSAECRNIPGTLAGEIPRAIITLPAFSPVRISPGNAKTGL